MTTLHIGASTDRAPRPRYLEKLSFAEYDFRSGVPSARTGARWKKDAGANFVSSLVAPPALWGERDWPLRDARSVERETNRLIELARGLGSRVVVLRSPASIRPGTPALTRMLAVAEAVKAALPVCVWEPQGVWSREEALKVVRDKGILVAADPLHDDVNGEPIVYARMRGLGQDRRYHEGRLEDLATALQESTEGFVVFATETAFAEAKKLRAIAEGLEIEHDEDDEESEDEEDDEDEDLDEDEA